MPSTTPSDGPTGDWASFGCRWRVEGNAAASVWVSGELDIATAPKFEAALDEALGHARLVLVDLTELSFLDSSGLHVIVNASMGARATGARVLLTGASKQVEALLEVTGTRAHLDVLRPGEEIERARPDRSHRTDEDSIRPLDNPVNASVITARVMAVSDEQLWLHAANGAIHRPCAPISDGLPVRIGTPIEMYLDRTGAVNGWREPRSGLAINQRCLETGSMPTTYSDLTCAGPCGVVWRAPAAERLAEREERCLTCAGPLVRG